MAKVFQRRAYQIQFLVVDNEETIVKSFIVANGEARVLRVEGCDVGRGNLAVRHVIFAVMLRGDNRLTFTPLRFLANRSSVSDVDIVFTA